MLLRDNPAQRFVASITSGRIEAHLGHSVAQDVTDVGNFQVGLARNLLHVLARSILIVARSSQHLVQLIRTPDGNSDGMSVIGGHANALLDPLSGVSRKTGAFAVVVFFGCVLEPFFFGGVTYL